LLALVKRQEAGPLDPERAAGIAAEVGAGLFVLGRVVEAGGRLNVSASIYDDRARLQNSAEAAADDEAQLFGMVDDLTRQMLGELAKDPTDRVVRIATTTTSDLRALKAFLSGEHEFRQGREEAAAEAFARAVEIDPEFAVAWYRLSLAAKWVNETELAWEALDNARIRMDRTSESTRRRIEAFDAFMHGDAAEAERLYRAILQSDPDDVDSWYLLAETLFHYNPRHGRPSTESREAFERTLSLDPEHHTALHHLSNVAAREHRTEELIVLIDQVLERYTDYWLGVDLEVMRAVVLEDADGQRELMASERVQSRGPDSVYDVAKHWQDLPVAQTLIEPFARPEHPAEDRRDALLALAVLELSQGRWNAARRQLESAEPIVPGGATVRRALMAIASWLPVNEGELTGIREAVVRWDADTNRPGQTYLLGELSARLGDREAVLQLADELERLDPVRGLGTVFQDMALALRARAAWMGGDAVTALDSLESATMDIAVHADASTLYGLGEMRWLRAELLSRLGREEEALRWYATLAERAFVHLIYLAPSHLRRAEIYERLGQPGKAAEHYARSLELWSDCDPELEPLVVQARISASVPPTGATPRAAL
jgi:tetratricopeptide (TPR) repeat protein